MIYMFYKSMKTEHVNKTINFKSGLTRELLSAGKRTKIGPVERNMVKYGTEADFGKNRSIAFMNNLCCDIFENIQKKEGIKLNYPPFIIAYNRKNISDLNFADNFCIPDTEEVLTNDYPYPARSIFFNDKIKLEELNQACDSFYNDKKISSSHFLSPVIHEWIHSFHLDYIYNKYGYGGDCEYLKSVYDNRQMPQKTGYNLLLEHETKTLSDKENSLVFDILGEYATKPLNQYLEILAETMSKFICDSLSEDCKLKKNPFDLIKKTPKEFQEILIKSINLSEFKRQRINNL